MIYYIWIQIKGWLQSLFMPHPQRMSRKGLQKTIRLYQRIHRESYESLKIVVMEPESAKAQQIREQVKQAVANEERLWYGRQAEKEQAKQKWEAEKKKAVDEGIAAHEKIEKEMSETNEHASPPVLMETIVNNGGLEPYIREACRVGKIPWTCSMYFDDCLHRHFDGKLEQETYEETKQRRAEEDKTRPDIPDISP